MTPTTQKSQLEKYEKGRRVSLLLIGFGKLQRRVSLTAESAESTFEPVHANGGNRWGGAGGTFGKSVCCAQSLLVASELVGHLRRDSAPPKVPKIICIVSVTISGFIPADVNVVICCRRVLSPPVKGHFLVQKFFDWTAEPNPAVVLYSVVFVLRSDPMTARLYAEPPKYPFTIVKAEQVFVIQL